MGTVSGRKLKAERLLEYPPHTLRAAFGTPHPPL